MAQSSTSKRVLITGSSDGLGLAAAKLLASSGHSVLLHGRNPSRAAHALSQCPKAVHAFSADLSSIAQTKKLAADVNAFVADKWGPGTRLTAVIHNAALGFQEPSRGATEDDLAAVFAVNSLAPYILTALIKRPERLVYVSSELHASGDASLEDIAWHQKSWSGYQAYSDSKLHNVFLSNAVARRWQRSGTMSNALTPGWVPTKMGGSGAPDDMAAAPKTQVWLAVADDATNETGGYWYHMARKAALRATNSVETQEAYLKECEKLSKVPLAEE